MNRVIVAPINMILIFSIASVFGQKPATTDYAAQVSAIQNQTRVKAANDYLDKNHEAILREWSAITEINAPSGQEEQRAAYIEKL